MTNKSVIESLKKVLADSYALYLKTQNYHWNVTGPYFKTLHSLFEEQYNDLALAVDEIAERIRALGSTAPGTWSTYSKLTSIKDGDENANAEYMVEDLANDQIVLTNALKQTLEAAKTIDDEVTIGLVVDRMTAHEKAAWMLRASM